MRTITKEINIYRYNELSNEAKETVKRWYLNTQESDIFTDMVNEDLVGLFGENDLEVQYDLHYCQGDGFNIYGDIDIHKIFDCIKKHNDIVNDNIKLNEQEIELIYKYADIVGNTIVLPCNNRYAYCMIDYIDIADNWYQSLMDELDYIDSEYYIEDNKPILDCLKNIDYELLNKFEKLIKRLFYNLCKYYEDWGYKFFYEISDSELEEVCEANDYEFYEDGNIISIFDCI